MVLTKTHERFLTSWSNQLCQSQNASLATQDKSLATANITQVKRGLTLDPQDNQFCLHGKAALSCELQTNRHPKKAWFSKGDARDSLIHFIFGT